VTVFHLAYGVLVIATVAVGGVMAVRIVPRIEEAAAGRTLLDKRVGGYNFAEARTFLRALTPEAANTYLRMAMGLDMIFPLLYGATIALAIQWTTPDHFPIPPYVMALAVLPAVIFDLRENALVAAMLMGGPEELKPELAARASTSTRWKWRLLAASICVLAVMAAVRFIGTTSQEGA